jgi:hypothetical protein
VLDDHPHLPEDMDAPDAVAGQLVSGVRAAGAEWRPLSGLRCSRSLSSWGWSWSVSMSTTVPGQAFCRYAVYACCEVRSGS